MREFAILQRKAINSQINTPPLSLYRGCKSHRKDKRNSLKGGDSERRSPSCAEIGSHVCEQRYQLCQRQRSMRSLLLSLPQTIDPPSTSTHTPIPNPSIARFICVSHYREWNVVPARCINRRSGEIGLLCAMLALRRK